MLRAAAAAVLFVSVCLMQHAQLSRSFYKRWYFRRLFHCGVWHSMLAFIAYTGIQTVGAGRLSGGSQP